jgi:hypothetical protein
MLVQTGTPIPDSHQFPELIRVEWHLTLTRRDHLLSESDSL